jgi:hypothetical protein
VTAAMASISGQGRAEIERAGFLHRPLFGP